MEEHFIGKTVLVTGAGWGIGAAASSLYAAYGANVVVSDTSRAGGKDTVTKMKGQIGDVTYIKTDVSNAAACEELIKWTVGTYGRIDIACNNSAIFSDGSDSQVALNLNSLNNCMRYEIEAMLKHGGGVIINTSSIVGSIGSAPLSPYVEAKYGIASLLQNIPTEYPAIHISTIIPAIINNAFFKDMIREKTDGEMNLFPIRRHDAIQEVAGLVLWLSSDEPNLLHTAYNDDN
jgi:NAD(P)-dependent dehydrogenase (short-subunit alcohol dehydrogenase family)